MNPLSRHSNPAAARGRIRPAAALLVLGILAGAPGTARARAADVAARAEEPAASQPDPFAPVRPLGRPVRYAPYVGVALATSDLDGGQGGSTVAFAGVRHEFLRPVIGVLGAGVEAYGGTVGDCGVLGGRARVSARALRIGTGLDFSSQDEGPVWLFTVEDPLLRGGFPWHGSSTRFEWIPARGQVGIGLTLPLFQPAVGRTRPRGIQLALADLPAEVQAAPRWRPAATDSALSESARWIDFLTTPHDPDQLRTNTEWMRFVTRSLDHLERREADHPDGHGLPQEIAFYHRRLEQLFRAALADDASGPACDAARRIVLDRVLLPWDADFGRLRDDRIFAALAGSARAGFAGWCDTSGVVPAVARERALRAFDRWLAVIHDVEHAAHRRWDDTRKIWLPLDLALRPEEHDSQAEIDALVEALLGGRFQNGNTYQYLVNEAFSPALIRSLHQASDYHVLWIHDFPGIDPSGDADSVGCAVVTRGYLDALTAAVRRMDEGGRLPAFVVLLDQWYFDGRKAAWWMRVLEDPLGESCALPKTAASQRAALFAARARLRAAVEASRTLHRLREERGDAWLHRYLRVHVNITFPGDPSFPGRVPVPTLPLKFSDDYMRDHTKVVFWDLSEEDPARGAALITGEGVGEAYEGSGWEDRTLLLRGPGALEFKRRARELLESQGLDAGRIPLPLHARPYAPDWTARVDSLVRAGNTARVLQAFNGTGYQRKSASVLKAALYNLMPAGSRILAPDSQWSSYFWAGMLAGAALRGVNVYVVAAGSRNAPYGDARIQNILTHDVLEGYVQIRDAFAKPLADAGGSLNVGVYGEDIGTRSLVDRYRSVLAGMHDPQFPRSAFPLPAETYETLADSARFVRMMRPLLALPPLAAGDPGRFPKLHLKCQFFASGEGIARLTHTAGWDSVIALYAHQRIEATLDDPTQAGGGVMSPALLAPVRDVVFEAPPESTAADVFYMTIGSHNQNDRSLLLDGEVLCVLAGPEALAPLVDFVAIAARSRWIGSPEELDQDISRYKRGQVKMARRLRSLF